MIPELSYIIKVNLAIALFYTFYRLFSDKDTFFNLKRFLLIGFLLISLIYPFFDIQEWMRGNEAAVDNTIFYATAAMPEYVLEIPQNTGTDMTETILTLTYFTVMALLTIRFIIRLLCILHIRKHSCKATLNGVEICIPEKKTGPFSFFKWIFINPELHTEKELSEILTHESSHAVQLHSIDVLLSETACIICWFNPFVWLMRQEIKWNLEYLADKSVIEAGHDTKSYQYHLLELTNHKAIAHIYNSFNVLPLKKRIRMMNKQKTKGIGKTKYIMLLPVVILLMIISNIEITARTANDVKDKVTEQTTNGGDVVFTTAEKMPEYPGGMKALISFMSENIKYTATMKDKDAPERVVVAFIVGKDGTISDAKVLRGVNSDADNEALRIVGLMPKWIPGSQKGKPVAVRYVLPIAFQGANYNKNKGAGYSNNGNTHMTVADEMPQMHGGNQALMQYLTKNVKYPAASIKNKEQGRVVTQMVIGVDGSISDVRIVKSVSPLLDAEALRVIRSMPKWEPGKQNGKPIAVVYTIPVDFRY